MAYEEDRPPALGDLAHSSETALLERLVSNAQHLVDEQAFRFQERCHGKGEADCHTARVPLHGRVDEALDLGELDDVVDLRVDLPATHDEARALAVHVLAPSQL